MLYSVSYLGHQECVGLTEYHQVLRSETKEVKSVQNSTGSSNFDVWLHKSRMSSIVRRVTFSPSSTDAEVQSREWPT